MCHQNKEVTGMSRLPILPSPCTLQPPHMSSHTPLSLIMQLCRSLFSVSFHILSFVVHHPSWVLRRPKEPLAVKCQSDSRKCVWRRAHATETKGVFTMCRSTLVHLPSTRCPRVSALELLGATGPTYRLYSRYFWAVMVLVQCQGIRGVLLSSGNMY